MSEIDYTTGSRGTVAVVAGGDSVRWGSVIAGLFVAMATLAVLGVLGVAVGLSAADASDRAANYGIGAGIWGALSALIAFFVGGYLAAWSAGGRGTVHGPLNGAMVWAVAIPLMIYLLAGGIGSLFRAAGSAAATTAQTAGSAAGAVAGDPKVREDVKATTQNVAEDVKAKAEELKSKVTPQRVEEAAHSAAGGAWGALAAMLLGLGAATLGGYFGSRHPGIRTVAQT